ncbi:MAG: formate dehydrogenase subunit gamma [Betaproteobacteria bacterium]|nr:formate dehydrogenase subunit gamma [Betaproteobacteria bacterium]MDE2624607.1 formate dehydrogenase subunit gamma [Betaproteobacteria bacterium]
MTTREAQAVDAALNRFRDEQGALLPVLHAVQDNLGYIPQGATPTLASAFNISRAEVHGVITYYHHFRQTEPAQHKLAICQAEACQARGCRSLTATAEAAVGCRLGEHTEDNRWELEPVYCLGLCASGPAVELDGKLYARITPERLEALIRKKELS